MKHTKLQNILFILILIALAIMFYFSQPFFESAYPEPEQTPQER